ncbi:MAG TPA: S-formylglutathione hydrolase [Steroidobacteraceae bacterium]|jgi:S-formylglutathione hydrolase|nr:S-formylglutathione hydrolase [Steroidobacteraceae bacterium]
MSDSVPFETVSKHRCFGGTVGFYKHTSAVNNCTMKFAVFTPPQAERSKVPVLYYLAGLTCTEETFQIKAGAQRCAAELGLMLVSMDTSPRGVPLPGDSDAYDFGVGAGFYLDATQEPWSKHYRMYSYVTQELPALIDAHFPVDTGRVGIFGHSMGGHGALTIGLKNPGGRYRSISAFAPISAPKQVPWGQKAFTNYLGPDQKTWDEYDATVLLSKVKDAARRPPILVDQGLADQFLEQQLHPHLLEAAAHDVGYPLTLRRQPGYDHGYYFISTFMDDHLRHHARILNS